MKKLVSLSFGNIPEKLSIASPSRQACAECSLHESCHEPFLLPYVPNDYTGLFAFVIEISRNGEENAGKVFLSQLERKLLDEVVTAARLSKSDIAFVPVVRCATRKPKMMQLRACRPFLLRALDQIAAKHILAFGDTCAKAVLNTGAPGPIASLRGRELHMCSETGGIPVAKPVFVTSKLSSLLLDPHAKRRVIEDLRKLQSPVLKYPMKGLGRAAGKPVLGFDTEFTEKAVHCLSLARPGSAITFDRSQAQEAAKHMRGATLVGHNLVVDLESLINVLPKSNILKSDLEEWLQGKKVRDTSLLARLADENRGKHGYKLESLSTAFFNIPDWKGPTEKLGVDSSKWPKALREERCRLDAWATLKVYDHLKEHVEGPAQVSHAVALSLRRMYFAGVCIDNQKFTKMVAEVVKQRNKTLGVVEKFARQFKLKDFSATKDNQIREYVYGSKGVGLDVESLTKGGLPTVSVKVLKEYENVPAINALLSFSKYDKLFTTYCHSLEKRFVKVGKHSWLPVQINPLAAKTGRRSSQAPNFQNLPVPIRKIVCSRFVNGSIADNDYSKLEPILGGWVTNEPRLTEYFVKYPNGYIKIGEDFFKKSVDKTSDQYRAVKALVLAIIYNKKKWSLAEDLWVNHKVKLDSNYEKHEDKAGEILNDFLKKLFPGVRTYHQLQEETVLTHGYVVNAVGQVRRLPLPVEPPKSEHMAYKQWCRYRAHVINQAINYPIQSLAAYTTGCALVDLEAAFLTQWRYTYVDYHRSLMEKKWPHMPLLCIEVHDDLVQDIPKGLEKKAHEITHDVMSKPATLVKTLPELFDSNVKLSVDTNLGPTWGLKS